MKAIKKPTKKKKPTLSSARNKALHELQRYVVEKSERHGVCKCVTCGCLTDSAQGGHYIGRDCRATELLEENVHPQCPICNCFGKGGGAGEMLLHGRWIAENLGQETKERLDNLYLAWRGNKDILATLSPSDQALVTSKKTVAYYQSIEAHYKALRKELKNEE